MKTVLLSFLFFATVVSYPGDASAGPRDPWYLGYVVRGGTIMQYMGPYLSEARCRAHANRIPRGTEFVGCFQ